MVFDRSLAGAAKTDASFAGTDAASSQFADSLIA
ncbi:hypothetical protein BJ956_001373 [Arthrobacter psychrochitiniphilus]|nr:hypothetical protein [Arthrobacter psychrochitiniphilus]